VGLLPPPAATLNLRCLLVCVGALADHTNVYMAAAILEVVLAS
jgi:hypothetical protein